MKNNLLTRFSSPWRFVWEQNELEMAGYKCQNLQHHRPWVTVARGKYIQSSSWLECTRELLFGSRVYWAYIICQSSVLIEKFAKEEKGKFFLDNSRGSWRISNIFLLNISDNRFGCWRSSNCCDKFWCWRNLWCNKWCCCPSKVTIIYLRVRLI